MNRIDQLEMQNLQDGWSILYLSIAQELLDHVENRVFLRKAVRGYGAKMGAEMRKRHQQTGVLTNLYSFYHNPMILPDDPRLAFEVQQLTEQTALFNVLRCPFGGCAYRYHAQDAAKVFCEEYTPACLAAYTGRVAQVNLSEVLTDSQNNHCRIASYFRPTNFQSQDVSSCFRSLREETIQEGMQSERPDAAEGWQYAAAALLDAFNESGMPREKLQYGQAVAMRELAAFLKRRAASMEQSLDAEFCTRNSPVWAKGSAQGGKLSGLTAMLAQCLTIEG